MCNQEESSGWNYNNLARGRVKARNLPLNTMSGAGAQEIGHERPETELLNEEGVTTRKGILFKELI